MSANRISEYDSHLERQLAHELNSLGIQFVTQFCVQTLNRGKFMADFYIPAPQRAIVEVMGALLPKHTLVRVRDQMLSIIPYFEGQVLPILAILGGDVTAVRDVFKDSGIAVVFAKEEEDSVRTLAEEIARVVNIAAERGIEAVQQGAADEGQLVEVSSLSAHFDKLEDTGPLADILISFRSRISAEAFQILRCEGRDFYREYTSGHYTTAVLCVGRTLEYIIYTLARAWGVPINKRTIRLLDNLEGKFSQMQNVIIDFAYAETEETKRRQRDKVKKALSDFVGHVNEFTSDVYVDHEQVPTDYPINTQSILRDVKKKYACLEVVRKELNALAGSDQISTLLKMRNRAAHADTSGNRTEFQEDDVQEVIQHLRSILFSLGNIADAIFAETART